MTTAWIDVRVRERRIAAQDIVSLVLEAANGHPLPHFDAGAHIDLELPNGLIRQYSLCGSPSRSDRYELGILREPDGRGGSRSAHEQIHQGDIVRISSPRNLFRLVPARHAILLAGGIGITPILAMAERLHADGASFELHYCARSEGRAAFLDYLGVSPFAKCVHRHFDDRPDTALDTKGLLNHPDPQTHLYVCGPGGFIDHVINTADAAGWQESNVHFERFSAPRSDHSADDAFEVQIAGSGKVLTVRGDQTVIAALSAQGIEIPVSCEQGICGTCLMRVVDGIPDHRDMYLSDEEHAANDCFTPCCSRALTPRLIIQL